MIERLPEALVKAEEREVLEEGEIRGQQQEVGLEERLKASRAFHQVHFSAQSPFM